MSPRDTALLERWVARRDAEAFNELVSRYAGLVYATCKRILRNEADAEDVAQECFLTLAQTDTRAAVSLAGWLHTVATRRSLNLLKRESRRRRRETVYAEQKPAAQVGWDDVKACVDEAVEELPERLRFVVVAHFLDRRTHNAIAKELGISRRAVTNRIHKGVDQIRKSLRRRGVPVGTSALAAMLTANAVEAAPATLASALGKIALAGAGTRIAVAAAGGGLVGGLAAMKSKIAGLAVLVALLAGVGTYVAFQGHRGPETERTANRSELSQAPSPEPFEPVPSILSTDVIPAATDQSGLFEKDDASRAAEEESLKEGEIISAEQAATISGKVTNEDGTPMSGVGISIVRETSSADDEFFREIREFRTASEADGRYEIEVAGLPYAKRMSVRGIAEGYTDGPSRGGVILAKPGEAQQDVDIVMYPGITLTGRVRTADGTAVTDGVVSVMQVAGRRQAFMTGKCLLLAYTDDEGMFRLVFKKPVVGLILHVFSETFGSGTFTDISVQEEEIPEKFSAILASGTFENISVQEGEILELRLAAQADMTGHITFANGAPAAGFTVMLMGDVRVENERKAVRIAQVHCYSASTDEAGRYHLRIDPALRYRATVRPERRGPILTKTRVIDNLAAGETRVWDVMIEDMITVWGRVYGVETGRPVGRLNVYCMKDGQRAQDSGGSVNADGSYELRPLAGPGRYVVYPNYYYRTRSDMAERFGKEVNLSAGDSVELDLTIPEPVTASIRVEDVQGKPIAGAQVGLMWYLELSGAGGPSIGRSVGETYENGRFLLYGITPGEDPWGIDVSKAGYVRTKSSLRYGGEPGEVYPEETILLYQSSGVEGVVADANGSPLSDTHVRVQVHYDDGKTITLNPITDEQGWLTIADEIPAATVVLEIKAALRGEGTWGVWTSEPLKLLPGHITMIGEIVLAPER